VDLRRQLPIIRPYVQCGHPAAWAAVALERVVLKERTKVGLDAAARMAALADGDRSCRGALIHE